MILTDRGEGASSAREGRVAEVRSRGGDGEELRCAWILPKVVNSRRYRRPAFENADLRYNIGTGPENTLDMSGLLLSDNPELPDSSQRRVFATTSWTRVISATQEEASERDAALAELCEIYWFPLYTFVRRKGYSRDDAEEITQSFFADILERKGLQKADANRGKFRTFLLTALSHFIANWNRDRAALKRGGGQAPFAMDFVEADERFTHHPADDRTPEKSFERAWAMELLASAMAAVEDQYREAGREAIFAELKSSLTGTREETLEELGKRLGMREGAVKVALHRLRQRYGDQLRLQIARTLADPRAVDEELRSLFQALA